MSNVNTVVITGNLTQDPDLRTIGGDTVVCDLRVAVNGREKREGEWKERPDYFDVTVWGKQAENCAESATTANPQIRQTITSSKGLPP